MPNAAAANARRQLRRGSPPPSARNVTCYHNCLWLHHENRLELTPVEGCRLLNIAHVRKGPAEEQLSHQQRAIPQVQSLGKVRPLPRIGHWSLSEPKLNQRERALLTNRPSTTGLMPTLVISYKESWSRKFSRP